MSLEQYLTLTKTTIAALLLGSTINCTFNYNSRRSLTNPQPQCAWPDQYYDRRTGSCVYDFLENIPIEGMHGH